MGSQSLPNPGFLTPWATWGEYNRIAFAINQAIGKLQTVAIVKVISCTNAGGISPVGLVNIVPLVNQVDSNGNPEPHTTIYNVPYLRVQGGSNAVIIDPQPGDLGIALFASRDISKVKTTKAQANPGSARQYDFSDALYLGGLLNAVPVQYVQFLPSGIVINSPTAVEVIAPNISLTASVAVTVQAPTISMEATDEITLVAPEITLDGAVTMDGGDATMMGGLAVTGDVTAAGTSLHTHIHTSEAPGHPTSPPL